MKKINWISCLLLLCSFLFVSSASAISLIFSPSSETVYVGESFDVDVVVSGLDAAGEIVSAFDLDVLYDASVLSATAVQFSGNLGEVNVDTFTSVFLTPGIIDFAELSLLSNSELALLQPDDSVLLASLSFLSLAEGVSSLVFDPITFPGVDVKGLDPFSTFDLSNTTGEGVATVLARIPEPGTVLLMIGGLLGMLSLKHLCKI